MGKPYEGRNRSVGEKKLEILWNFQKKKVLSSVDGFTMKYKSDGPIELHKACFVAKGYTQAY